MTFNQSGICKKIEVRSFSAYIVHALQVKHVFLLIFFHLIFRSFPFLHVRYEFFSAKWSAYFKPRRKSLMQTFLRYFGSFRLWKKYLRLLFVLPVWSHINNYWCALFQWYILSPYRQILNIKSKHIITHNGITHGVLADTNNASIRSNIRIICCDLSCDLLLIYQFERIQTHIYKVSWMVINACNIQHLHAIDFWSMVADPVNDTVVPRAY